MEPIQVTTQEFFLYTILANTAMGFLIGLVPLAAGFIRHQRKYGFYGLIACVVGGAILGIFLSLPLAAVFTWLVLKTSHPKSDSISTGSGDNSPAS